MSSTPQRIFGLLLPLAAAFFAVEAGPYLADATQVHQGLAPLLLVTLFGGLLIPAARQRIIVALCFSVSLLALKDAREPHQLPPSLNLDLFQPVYPLVWAGVSLLAFAAAISEALRPGSFESRRLYFATASLYLIGHGVTAVLWEPTWEGLVMTAAGVFAAAGALYADRLGFGSVPVTARTPAEIDRRAADRKRRLASLEWREPEDPNPA